ncbi:sulfotransferase [Streptomyces albidoflavus]|uniref:sulfotransferase n=1 Tax=Streptomyces TaxID=1883 RepID=UPI001C2E9FC0|nr:sulfotransferase [Streptomyces sp. BV333]MBV1957164.1 sulfotransferase [Streptomyces sp. BV333]
MTASPVILLGGQRCGTTALAYALNLAFDDHGGHFTVNGKLPYLLHRWLTREDLRHGHLRADEILHALDRRPPDGAGAARWRERVERSLRQAAREVAEGRAGEDPAALGRRILTESAGELPYWGDKYNEYLLHLDHLDALLPDARYVMLVRHPEEAARSMLRWTGDRPWLPATREAALAKWTSWNSNWPGLAGRLPAGRKLVVEYQALCRGEATGRLSEFTGLDLAPYLAGLKPRTAAAPEKTALPAPTARLWARLRTDASSPGAPAPTLPQPAPALR